MNNSGRQRSDLQNIARRAMAERGFLCEFSLAVRSEIEGLRRAEQESNVTIRDLRNLLWVSIDNDDSLDLDQLTVAEPLENGVVRILVAIADVDVYVGKGSAIDLHAAQNTTSVYAGAMIFSMLPEQLSTDLTSLNEGEDRLSVVTEMVIGREGDLEDSSVYRARVRNHAKLTYNGVATWLDGGPIPERMARVGGLDLQIRIQDDVAQRLKQVRHECGALHLEVVEAKPVFDGEEIRDLELESRNRAKELIENFMIATNGVTARYLKAKKYPALQRVVRSPKRWQRIVAVAAELGEKLPSQPNAAALEAFLVRMRKRDPLRFPDLSLVVVKLMGSGEYVVDYPDREPIGHFGLAAKDYTHSTAPNRRYPDLITQRLLKAAIAGRPSPYGTSELEALARHCTDQEDDATKIERRMKKSAAALLLKSRIGDRFDGVVTGSSVKGTWVRIFRPPAEGRVIDGFEGLDVGDRVRVRLVDTNVELGFIDFARERNG